MGHRILATRERETNAVQILGIHRNAFHVHTASRRANLHIPRHRRILQTGRFVGTIYLLHFDKPIGNINGKTSYAQHYTGYVDKDLARRIQLHRTGQSDVKIMTSLYNSGIGFELVRIWSGNRAREKQIKRSGSAKRYCPKCGIKPRKFL